MKTVLSLRNDCAQFRHEPVRLPVPDLCGRLFLSLATPGSDLSFQAPGLVYRLALFLVFSVTTGCQLLPRGVTAPAAELTLAGGARLKQNGSAESPAKVTSDTVTSTVPIPAGSTVTVNEKEPGKISVTLAGQTEIKTETRKESAEGAKAFEPPAPPKPTEIAAGRAAGWFWVGLVAGAAAGVFGLVRNWDLVMYGGGAVAAGCVLGLFVQQHPLVLVLVGCGVAAAVIGPTLWHLKLKHLEPKSP